MLLLIGVLILNFILFINYFIKLCFVFVGLVVVIFLLEFKDFLLFLD